MPAATEMPWPIEPVVISTPSTLSRSACEGRSVPFAFSVNSFCSGMNPRNASVAYSAGAP